jgi:hypothetical protein
MHKILLITLGLGGILFSLLIGVAAWFESGPRRKNVSIFTRIILWGIILPVALTISTTISFLLVHLLTGAENIMNTCITITAYGTLMMLPVGLLGGVISHFLLKYTNDQ